MNKCTWTDCIRLAIQDLEDCGLVHISNKRTVRMLNQSFRHNEKLQSGYLNLNQEPQIFSVYPKVRDLIVKFCNEQVSEGTLSTDIVRSHIKNNILENVYEEYCNIQE